MKTKILFFVLCMAFVVQVLAAINVGDESIVQTKYGAVQGNVYPGYRNWQGVPFASPPLGNLRYKNPVPPTPWNYVKNCTYFIIGCAQTAHSLDVPSNTSEDCLYLEIWAPRAGKYKDGAAVMLWFYGGDFKEGGESFALYNGGYIASTTNTIIIATNYRIGNLGFLYAPGAGADVNVGIEDQRFALQWIQDNIQAFGGDPNKVTIFGQSAGGESVLIHLATPKAYTASHFQRAIVQSGPLSLNFKYPDAADLLGRIFAFHLGCSYEDLNCLQNASTKEILDAAGKSFIVPLDVSEAVMQWAPVVTGDKDFPVQPLTAFEKGDIVKVPLMIGSDSSDGVLFGYAISPQYMPSYEYIAIVVGIFQGDAGTVLDLYPAVYDDDNRAICSTLLTDYLFMCCSRKAARLVEALGGNNTYYYQFTRKPEFCPWPPSQKFCCGVPCHGTEIPFVFYDNGNPYPWNFTAPDQYLASAMANYWVSFAHFGDPNKLNQQGVPTWPVYQGDTDYSIEFDSPITVISGLNKANCDMFDSIGYDHSTRDVLSLVRNLNKQRFFTQK